MYRVAPIVILLFATPAAAEPGWASATLQSGLAYYAAGDFAGARPRLQALADRGSAIAETMLGVMALRGQGRARDPATAVSCWLRAANRGYAPAQLALAKAMARGEGVGVDRESAWVWARLAASDALVGNDAARLADSVGAGFDAARLSSLEARRARWRPWAGN